MRLAQNIKIKGFVADKTRLKWELIDFAIIVVIVFNYWLLTLNKVVIVNYWLLNVKLFLKC